MLTSRAKVAVSQSDCAARPLRVVVMRDTASERCGVSRSAEGRNDLMGFPLSSELLGSEPMDPETAADVPDSDDGRGRD
jgi:hypothetical protein